MAAAHRRFVGGGAAMTRLPLLPSAYPKPESDRRRQEGRGDRCFVQTPVALVDSWTLASRGKAGASAPPANLEGKLELVIDTGQLRKRSVTKRGCARDR